MLKRGSSGSFGEEKGDEPRSNRPMLATVHFPRPVFTSDTKRWKRPELSDATKMLVRGFVDKVTAATPLQRFAANSLFESQVMRCVDAFLTQTPMRELWPVDKAPAPEAYRTRDGCVFDAEVGEVYMWLRASRTLTVASLDNLDSVRTLQLCDPLIDVGKLVTAYERSVVIYGIPVVTGVDGKERRSPSAFHVFDAVSGGLVSTIPGCSHCQLGLVRSVVFDTRRRRLVVSLRGSSQMDWRLCVLHENGGDCVASSSNLGSCAGSLYFDRQHDVLWWLASDERVRCLDPSNANTLWTRRLFDVRNQRLLVLPPGSAAMDCGMHRNLSVYRAAIIRSIWSSKDGISVLVSSSPVICAGTCRFVRCAVLTFPFDLKDPAFLDLSNLFLLCGVDNPNLNWVLHYQIGQMWPHPSEGAFICFGANTGSVFVVPGCF